MYRALAFFYKDLSKLVLHGFGGDEDGQGVALIGMAVEWEAGVVLHVFYFGAGALAYNDAGSDVPQFDIPAKGPGIGAQSYIGVMQSGTAEVQQYIFVHQFAH